MYEQLVVSKAILSQEYAKDVAAMMMVLAVALEAAVLVMSRTVSSSDLLAASKMLHFNQTHSHSRWFKQRQKHQKLPRDGRIQYEQLLVPQVVVPKNILSQDYAKDVDAMIVPVLVLEVPV